MISIPPSSRNTHAGALVWRRGPVCACTRVCWCRRIFTYIYVHPHTNTRTARAQPPAAHRRHSFPPHHRHGEHSSTARPHKALSLERVIVEQHCVVLRFQRSQPHATQSRMPRSSPGLSAAGCRLYAFGFIYLYLNVYVIVYVCMYVYVCTY